MGLVTLWLITWNAAAAQRAPTEVTHQTATLLGSSSVGGHLGHTLVRELAVLGVRVRLHRRSATGLARPDYFDWPRAVRRGPDLSRQLGVMVLLGGNDTQPLQIQGRRRAGAVRWDAEDAWRTGYAERVHAFGQELCARGARRVVWLLPPNPGRGAWSERLARVRRAQQEGATRIRCEGDAPAIVIDGDSHERPFGARDTRDGVHLHRAGAERYWTQAGASIVQALGVHGSPESGAAPTD